MICGAIKGTRFETNLEGIGQKLNEPWLSKVFKFYLNYSKYAIITKPVGVMTFGQLNDLWSY